MKKIFQRAILILCCFIFLVLTACGSKEKKYSYVVEMSNELLNAHLFDMDSNRGPVSLISGELMSDMVENPKQYADTEIIFQEEVPTDTSDENLIIIYPSTTTMEILESLNKYLEDYPISGYGGQGADSKKVTVQDILDKDNFQTFSDLAYEIEKNHPATFRDIF